MIKARGKDDKGNPVTALAITHGNLARMIMMDPILFHNSDLLLEGWTMIVYEGVPHDMVTMAERKGLTVLTLTATDVGRLHDGPIERFDTGPLGKTVLFLGKDRADLVAQIKKKFNVSEGMSLAIDLATMSTKDNL